MAQIVSRRPRTVRFSLRSLLGLLTMAALSFWALARYTREPPFEIIGDITRQEVAEIVALIPKGELVAGERITEVRAIRMHKEVSVTTEEHRDKHCASGSVFLLFKDGGAWRLADNPGDRWFSYACGTTAKP